MTYVRKQHYVPRFYPRNFTFDTAKNLVFCYDKTNDNIFQCNIKDIAQQPEFYESYDLLPNEIEKRFSHFESKIWASSLALLLQQKNYAKLKYQEKKNVLHFLALQHIRTPSDKESIVETNNAIADKAKETNVGNFNLKKAESDEEKQELYLRTVYGKDIDGTIDTKINSFLQRRWIVLLKESEKVPLYTSDNPIAFGNSSGYSEYAYSNPCAIIYFPLASDALLCSFDSHFIKRNNEDVVLFSACIVSTGFLFYWQLIY